MNSWRILRGIPSNRTGYFSQVAYEAEIENSKVSYRGVWITYQARNFRRFLAIFRNFLPKNLANNRHNLLKNPGLMSYPYPTVLDGKRKKGEGKSWKIEDLASFGNRFWTEVSDVVAKITFVQCILSVLLKKYKKARNFFSAEHPIHDVMFLIIFNSYNQAVRCVFNKKWGIEDMIYIFRGITGLV